MILSNTNTDYKESVTKSSESLNVPDSINQEVPKYGDTFKTNVTFGYKDDHVMPKKKLKFRYRKVSVNYRNSHTNSR